MIRDAILSPCGRYRYTLSRWWEDGPSCLFVMLNPSTADADVDDPTIRRCIGFARDLGFAGLTVANLYALRSTDPRALRAADDPVGPANDAWIARLRDEAVLAICAWGSFPAARSRAAEVLDILREGCTPVRALAFTKDGSPRHPLYLPRSARPQKIGGRR